MKVNDPKIPSLEYDESIVARLAEARARALEIGKLEQFEKALVHTAFPTFFGAPAKTELYPDFAPYSFGFSVYTKTKTGEWKFAMNGGLIFHQSAQEWGVHT